ALIEAIGITLEVAGQSLVADLSVNRFRSDRNNTPGNSTDDIDVLRLSLRNVNVSFGSATENFVTLSEGTGEFLVLPEGLAAELAGILTVNVPNVSATGNFALRINTTGMLVDESYEVFGTPETLTLPAGPYFQIAGTGVELNIAGQELGGDFTFEQNADGSVRVDVENASLTLGDGTTDFVAITGGFGTFLIDAEGVAGGLSVEDVKADFVTISGVTLTTDNVTIQVNTRPNAVTDEFMLGTGARNLTLPAGPYLRVEVLNASLTIDNLVDAGLRGNFAFDQVDGVARLALFDVTAEVSVNGEKARLINGLGALVITADGIAGTVEGSLDVALGGLEAGGDLFLRVNNTGQAIDETILIGTRSILISFSEEDGMVFSVALANSSLRIGDVLLIQGSFTFTKRGSVSIAGGAGVTIFIGEGEPFLEGGEINSSARGILIENANIGLVKVEAENGPEYAVNANGEMRVIGIAGLNLSGSIDVRVNSSDKTINEIITVPGLESPILVKFEGDKRSLDGLNPFVEIKASDILFDVEGLSINADLSFNRPNINLGNGKSELALLIKLTNVSTEIGDGLITLEAGQGDILILSEGIVASISGDINAKVPNLTLLSDFKLKINNTGTNFELFDIQGAQSDISVRAGPFIQVTGDTVEIDIAGQRLRGNFDFKQLASGKIEATFSGVSLTLGFGGDDEKPFISISGAAGDFEVSSTGISGILNVGPVDVSPVPGLEFSTESARIEINTNPSSVTRDFSLAQGIETLTLPAGPFVRLAIIGSELTLNEFDDLNVNAVLAGDFFFESFSNLTRIAMANITVAVDVNDGEASLINGIGALVVKSKGVAGTLSGDLAASAGGLDAGGTLILSVNNTGGAVDETIQLGGSTINVFFGANEGSVFSATLANASLLIGDIVLLEGSFSFTDRGDGTSVVAGTGLRLFVGEGPATLADGSINPFAKGLLIDNASVGLVKIIEGTSTQYALDASGEVSVVGLPDISLSGTIRVRVNSSNQAVDETITIPGTSSSVNVVFDETQKATLQGESFVSIKGLGVTIGIGDQVIQSDVSIEQRLRDVSGTPFDIQDDRRETRLILSEASLKISNGDSDYVTVIQGFGEIVISDAGLMGAIGGTFAVAIPGVGLDSNLNILVNTTGEASSDKFIVASDGTTREGIEAGNFFQAVGEQINLKIAGQELSGNIFLRNEILDEGSTITLLGLSKVSASFGDGNTTFLSLSKGSGILRVTSAGVAGQFSVSVATDPSLGFSLNVDEFEVVVNTTKAMVRETISLSGEDLILDLPAGPYFRIAAIGAELAIADQSLAADVFFQQSTVNGKTETRVVITNASLQLGSVNDPFVKLSDGRGILLIKSFGDNAEEMSSGLVGTLSGSFVVNIPSVTFTGDLGIEINQTPAEVNEIFEFGGETVAISLPAGSFFKVSAKNAEVGISGQTLSGNFVFTETADLISVEVTDAELNFGGGLLVATIESGELDLFDDGIFSEMTGGVRFGSDDIKLSVASVGLKINTRTSAPAQFVRVVAEDVVVSIPGIDIRGEVLFEQVTVGIRDVVRVAISGASTQIGGVSNPLVSIRDSSAKLLILPEGIAGQIKVGGSPFNIPGLEFLVDEATLQVNTLPFAVTTEMTSFAGNAGFALPKGPFIRVEAVNATIKPLGLLVGGDDVSLSGDFLFEQRGEGLAEVTTLAASNVSAAIEFEGKNAQLVDGEGVFVLANRGLAGILSGRADIALGPIGAGGDLALRINNTGGAINKIATLGGSEISIAFSANEGNIFDVSISDLTINISDFVTISGNIRFTESTITVGDDQVDVEIFAGEDLEIFLGQGPLRIGDEAINPLAKGALLTNGRVGLIKIAGADSSTFALVASGTVELIGVDGVTISADASVRVNTTGLNIAEVIEITGSTSPGVAVNFQDDGAEVKQFVAIDATLDILGQSIQGDFDFSQATTLGPDGAFGNPDDGSTLTIEATEVNISLGSETAGVDIVKASGVLIVTEAGIAGTISGGVGVKVPGIIFQGIDTTQAIFEVSINTTPTAVDESFMVGVSQVDLNLPAGQFFRVEAEARLIVEGQSIEGRFAIESTTDAATGASLLTIRATEVEFALTSGREDVGSLENVVALTNGSGALVISDAGLAGEINGSIEINLGSDVEVQGDFSLLINNTNAAVSQDFTIAGETYTLELPFGPYVRFEATNVEVDLFNQTLAGDVTLEQVQSLGADGLPGGTGENFDSPIVRVGFNNVSINLADGLLTLDNGTGLFVVTDAGLAGRISGDVSLGVEGALLEGGLTLEVNNTGVAVDEILRAGSATLNLQIDAGQTFRISGDDVTLVIADLRLKADFEITETTIQSGAKALHVAATDLNFGMGGTEAQPIIGMTVDSAEFLFLPDGVAARVTGIAPTLNVDGVILEGTVDFELNTTTTTQLAIEDFAGIGANTVRLNADTDAEISVSGQTIEGKFSFEQVTNPVANTSIIRVTVTEAEILLGTEGAQLDLSNGSGLFLLTSYGFAAEISATVEILPVDTLRIEGKLTLQINTTGNAISETFQVGAATRTLELPSGPYFRVTGNDIILAVAGQRLSGNFVFESIVLNRGADVDDASDDTTAIRIAITNAELGLGDKDREFIHLTNGEGYFLLINKPNDEPGSGVAGKLTVDVETDLPDFEFNGTLTLELNQTGRALDEEFLVDNITQDLELDIEKVKKFAFAFNANEDTYELEEDFFEKYSRQVVVSKYFRVGGTNISIEIGEQTLQGKFAFEQQQDENGDQVTILSFDEVSLGLGDGSTDFVNVTLASGELVLLSTGVTGSFTGVVALNVPDVTMTGTATVTFDTAANEFRVEVRPPEVEPPEEGKVLINVLSQHIKADLIVIEEFTLAGGEQVVRLHITKFFLALNDGTNPIIEVTADETTLVVNSRGMGLRVANAEITADLGPNLGLIVEKANFLLNTTGAEVDLGPGLPPLPAGPYVRVEVVSGSLNVGPITIVGGFLFDQTTDGAGNITTRIAIDQASLTVDDEDVAAADGAVVLLADGIAGNLTGSIESGGGGASVGAAVTVSINTTGREVNETIMLGDREFVIDLQKIDPNGGVSINISATVRIGDFIFLEFDGNQFSGTGKIFVGQGPAFLEDEFDDAGERVVNPSAQGFLLNDAQFTRSADDSLLVAEGTVSVIGLDGFALSGTVRLVYGAAAGTGRTLTLPGGTPEDIVSIPDTPGTIITVDDFDLEIAGQVVNGDFRFAIDQNSIEVGVENLYVGLGSTTRDENNDLISDTFITLTSSASTFSYTYTSPGFFGVLEGTLNIVKPIPNVDFGDSGLTAKLEINTTPISQEVKAAGMDITLSSGPFARVTAVIPEVVIFGSSLSGTFSFEQSVGELSQEAKDREAIDPSLAVEPPKFIKIGVTNLNIFLGDRGGVGEDDDAGLAISDGTGAFVIKSGAVVTDDQGVSTQLPGSFSGEANGTIGLSVPGVDVGFSGNFSLRVNTGTAEVQEVVQLGEQTINLNISAGPYLQVSATQLELTLLGQTLSGNFIFKEVSEGGQKILRIAASEVFIGLGDGTQDLVSINQGYAAIRIDQNGIAGAITGNFTESIPGVTIAANMSLIFNTGTVEVTETIVIPGANDVTLDVPRAGAGSSFIRFFAESIDVVIAGQTLTGNFQFEQGVRPDGEEYLKLGIQNGLLELGDGFASLNDLEGELLVSRGGVAGLLSLGASLDLGPVNISANKIIIRVNSGTAPVILDDAAATRIEGGPFFEFAAIGGNISVGGNNSVAEVVLEADFFVRKETNANGQDRLTILVENLNIDFEGIAIAEGSGTLLILPDVVGADGIIVPDTGGIAGTLNATVDLGDLVDGVELSGTSSLEINNTNGRVIDTVQVGENTVDIDLPAGPYFRIGVANAVLSIAGQSLSGSFAIENVTTSTGTLLSITALDVALSLGDGQKEYVSLTKGVGTLLVIENTINNVTTKGLAGRISGTVELKNIPGVSLSSELVLEINNTNMPINTSVEVGGVDLPLVLDTGDYIRFVAVDTLLAVAGQSIGGNFFFERSIIPGIGTAPPATVIRLGGSNINFFLGDDMGTTDGVADQVDDAGLRMTGGTLALVVTPDGVGGVIGGSVSLRIPGLVETTATVNVMINNTGKALTSTFPIPNADGTGDLTLGFEAGVYFKVTIEDFSLEFFGQTLTGDFSFEQITGAGADGLFDTTDDKKTLRLAIANLSLFLGDDGGTAGFDKDSDDIGLWITDGTASLIVTPRGLAGEFSAAAAVYITQGEGIAVERVTVRINSTNVAVSETFRTGNIEQTLTLPAGPYLSVKVEGLEVELAGQNIQGDFTFIRETNLGNDDDVGGVGSNADTSTTRIMLENVLVSLSANGREFVRAESPTGSPSVLEIVSGTNGGIVGFVSVQVSVSIPGVSVGGLFRVSFNSMTAPGATPNAPRVQIPYELDDDGIPSTPSVTLEAGITVSGIGVFLDVLGQRLTGNFSFEKSAGEIVIAVTHTVLELGNGDETFITATVEHG
ncbi:hypothetical protein N8534_00340, partial [bacterium]|nr:hypothetical protein [bacterium]